MMNEHIKKRRINQVRFLSLIFITLFFIPLFFTFANLYNSNKEFNSFFKDYDLKQSVQWGWVNLTNSEINGQYFSHNDPVPVQGRLYHAPNGTGFDGYTIYLKIDGQVLPQYQNITAGGGYFTINNYTIPMNMNIYVSHKIEVDVDRDPIYDVIYVNYFTFELNSTSQFDILSIDRYKPYLRGESIDITGSLLFDNTSAVPNEAFKANWYTNSDMQVTSDSYSTTATGAIPTNIIAPDDPNSLDNMTLELLHLNNPVDGIGPHAVNETNIFVFENVTFLGLPTIPGDAGSTYTITGQAISSTGSNFAIFNRTVRVVYNFGQVTTTAQTLKNGSFTITFNIPNDHDGSYSYYIEIVNSAGKSIISQTKIITINPLTSTSTGTGPGAPAPFAIFLIYFIPIVSVIAGILILYGYYFLKKQREEAQVSHIPLEGKITNLKILKDSGRMEESLSYLFNAIFITLIDAKFGRKKKDFETIRDFAIISVKELKLKPSVIYPFITKVEEIIYSRPFEITDNDFHTVVDLFSRVYFELTNYNFILKF